MKRTLLALVALLGLAVAVPTTTFAATTVYTPSITVNNPPTVDQPATFATDANCISNRCDWSWVYLSGGAYKNGGQMGSGQSVSYAFTAFAASKPYVVVKVKVTSPGGTNNFVLGQRAFFFGPTPLASHYLTVCSSGVWYHADGTHGALASCSSHANNGGLNQVEAVAICYDGRHNYIYTAVGNWVGEDVVSFASCGGPPGTAGSSYYLR